MVDTLLESPLCEPNPRKLLIFNLQSSIFIPFICHIQTQDHSEILRTMSLEDGDSLPLITEPQCIVDVPGLHSAWTALLKLREEVTRGRATLERNTGPLTLALKYLQAKLGRTRDNAPDKATKAALGSAAGALAQATRWVRDVDITLTSR